MPNSSRFTPSERLTLSAVLLAALVASFMQALIVPIIPQLPEIFHTTTVNASWIITATLVSAAVSMPICGRLADMHGIKVVMLSCVGLLILGSLLCATTSQLAVMVAGRALQGVAMSVVPLGITHLYSSIRPEKTPLAVALTSSALGVGGALGLPLAGWLAFAFHWQALFFTSAALGVISISLVFIAIDSPRPAHRHSFDAIGALGLTVGLTLCLVALSRASTWGWSSAPTLGCIAAGIAVLCAWTWWQLTTTSPLVDIHTTASRPVALTNIASILVGMSLFVQMIIYPIVIMAPENLAYGHGKSAVLLGFLMAPAGAIMMAISPLSARLTVRFGPKITLIIGCLTMTVGYSLIAAALEHLGALLIGAMIVGAGCGIAYAAMPALIMLHVPLAAAAAANGLNGLMRSAGTALAAAAISAILVAAVAQNQPGGVILPHYWGVTTSLAVGAFSALIAAGISFFIPAQDYAHAK